MSDVDVLIIGAGPTGLVLALWLSHFGVRVRIIDKTAEPGTTSRALAVQARTLELYRQLQLTDAVIDAGHKVAAANLWVRGKRAARLPLADLGAGLSPFPFALMFPQDAHERLLIGRLADAGVHVERRATLAGFEQNDTGVMATIARADGSRETISASYIAGCDGAHSTVRDALRIGFPGSTYEGVFYVADVDASGPAADGELHVELDEADFLAVFPLKGEGRLRLIGPIHLAAGDAEPTFEDVDRRASDTLHLRVDRANWFSTYHVHHRVADRFRSGRAFLLGDAAHIHSPVGGQGMNTGIGDAINLAWKLAAVVHGDARAALLDTYEPERIGFARRLVETTDRAFTIVTKPGRLARWVRTRVVPRVAPLLTRFRAGEHFLFL
ncbi:MAG TPA: FAD-dependent monooxygenase, partial [Gemmatimonadaceae bacterium]|nr:FAD-dependent monooxygenase [Gemmatimonadaceae bacterium]